MAQLVDWFGSVPGSLWRRIPQSTQRAIQLAFVGICIGLVTVGFHYSTEWLFENSIERAAGLGTVGFLLVSFLSVVGAGVGASILIHYVAPSAAGGGVMPTKIAFWKDFGVIPMRTAVVKFFGSALTLGGGVSMGPEGPAVQIGAASASALGSWMGVAKQERRALCACGAAAALAAAFNAPLAAILFVLEEIINDLNSRLIGGILLAAVMGAMVAHALIGAQPAYQVATLGDHSWKAVILCMLVSAVATVAGALFQKGSMYLRGRIKETNSAFPGWMKPTLGALASWAISAAVFLACGHVGVFGIGYRDVTVAIAGSLTLGTASLLFFGKLAATVCAVGTGNCGGIFAPSFFIGAMSGAAVVALAAHVTVLPSTDVAMLVMVGMCACLGTVTRAPLTSVLLIFEVTHQFSIIPLVLLATLVSQLLARRIQAEGMYEEMLLQDGQNPQRVLPPRDYKRWKEMHVGTIAQYQVIAATGLDRESLTALLKKYAYHRFPVIDEQGKVTGVLTREEAERFLTAGEPPHLHRPHWVSAAATLGEAQNLIIDAAGDILCVGSEAKARVDGILTLHDFLRAQARLGDDAVN